MIKTIVFDIDGVLADLKRLHYECLNKALEEVGGKTWVISEQDHLTKYDGLPTRKKLEKRLFTDDSRNRVFDLKQKYTKEAISELKKDEKLVAMFSKLSQNYKILVASNAIRETVKLVLLRLGVIEYVYDYLSNEDVVATKPSPEIYLRCMIKAGSKPSETLIIEDSPVGVESAKSSGAYVLRVKDSKDLTLEKIEKHMDKIQETKHKFPADINVLIPMAGAGSRFEKAGYTFPKPLIEVRGEPMIQVIVDNLNLDANYIFVCQWEHYEKYNLTYLLPLIARKNNIAVIDTLTDGACRTALFGRHWFDDDKPLLICNSDQFLEWDAGKFLYYMQETKADGGIVTFTATHPKWSFAKVNEEGNITEVAEKKPISNCATVGIYYWAKGSDFVKYAEQMISKDIRTNGELYIAPVYNEAIADGKIIKNYHIDKMWGLGTPEDLTYFLENYKGEV